jgi:hypothetical protein
VMCWGYNTKGELGLQSTFSQTVPTNSAIGIERHWYVDRRSIGRHLVLQVSATNSFWTEETYTPSLQILE